MFENVHLLCQMESILQMTIKMIHIIKKFIEKNIDDKNILTTQKNIHNFFNVEFSKL